MFHRSWVRIPAPYTEWKKLSANVHCTSLLDVVDHLFCLSVFPPIVNPFSQRLGLLLPLPCFFIAAAAAKVTDFVEYETNLKRD